MFTEKIRRIHEKSLIKFYLDPVCDPPPILRSADTVHHSRIMQFGHSSQYDQVSVIATFLLENIPQNMWWRNWTVFDEVTCKAPYKGFVYVDLANKEKEDISN